MRARRQRAACGVQKTFEPQTIRRSSTTKVAVDGTDFSGSSYGAVAGITVATLVLLARAARAGCVARSLLPDYLARVHDRTRVDSGRACMPMPVTSRMHGTGFTVDGWCGVLQLLR